MSLLALANRKRYLLQQIQKEERLVRIYEAELSVLRGNKKRRRYSYCYDEERDINNNDGDDDDEDRDWLETLDQLQCKKNDDDSILDTRWHDDPIHRVLPRIAGVHFTHVAPSSLAASFEFHAVISAARATPLKFCLVLEVKGHRIVRLAVTYPNMQDTSELNDATQCALEANNLPYLIRLLVTWAKLDAQRHNVFHQLVAMHKCIILAPSTLSIRGVVVSWTMKGCLILSGAPLTGWNEFLTCCGSIESALEILCRTVTKKSAGCKLHDDNSHSSNNKK